MAVADVFSIVNAVLLIVLIVMLWQQWTDLRKRIEVPVQSMSKLAKTADCLGCKMCASQLVRDALPDVCEPTKGGCFDASACPRAPAPSPAPRPS